MDTMNSMNHFLGTSMVLEVARQRRDRFERTATNSRLGSLLRRGARSHRGRDPGRGGALVELPLVEPALPRPVEADRVACCTAA